jgi:diguanylate cyclase (GGDEF)-like protein
MQFLLQPNQSPAQLFENAFKAALDITKMPLAGVMRLRLETHLRVEALADQVNIGYRAGEEHPLNELLEGEVVRKRDSIVIPDIASTPLARHPARMRFGIRSFVGTPLLMRNQQLYGVLSMADRKPMHLGPEELMRIGLLGQWLSQQLELRHMARELHAKNERLTVLSQELQRMQTQIEQGSIRDPITELFNRRHFNKLLHTESARAQRHAYPLTLLLIYPDGFNSVMRQWGAETSNSLLRSIGVLLRRHLRNIDSAARYTEDMFAVLLPQTPISGATIVGERIRAAIAGHQFTASRQQQELNLTVSLGISALLPLENDPAAALLSRARTALEQARNVGGNRVVPAQSPVAG